MMKKVLMFLVVMTTILSAFTMVYAEDGIKVVLNDETINFVDENGNIVSPQIINDRTMVPMRKIFEVLNMNVGWNGETSTVTARNDEKTIVLKIGNEIATVEQDGKKEEIKLDSVPVIIDGRTLVPVRFIAESLDLYVGWEGDTQTVAILDTSFIKEKIKEECPTFYEFLTISTAENEAFKMNVKATATVKYTDGDNRKNNTNLKVVLTGTETKTNDALAMDFTATTSGKGTIYEAIKERKFNKITLKSVLDLAASKLYVKSSLLEESIGSKWAELIYDKETIATNLMTADLNTTNVDEMIEEMVGKSEITTKTYSDLNMLLDSVCKLANDEHFTVSGRTAKTYVYSISLKDIFDNIDFGFDGMLLDSILKVYDASLTVSTKVENNIPTESEIIVKCIGKMDTEKIDAELTATSEITLLNSELTISTPKASEIGMTKNMSE